MIKYLSNPHQIKKLTLKSFSAFGVREKETAKNNKKQFKIKLENSKVWYFYIYIAFFHKKK